MAMEFSEIETVYERLAGAIDEAGEEKTGLFLAKVALLLSYELGDPAKAAAAIETALKDL
ncbi:MAG: DUF2783 domain-containing protein [Pseudomonadota bacterium]